MGSHRMLFLVDGQLHRRNAICRALTEHQVYVEPFESLGELHSYGPREGVVMAADEPDTLEGLIGEMVNTGRWLPVIAFAESATARRIAHAIHAGAATYVTWPCPTEELIAAMSEAQEYSELLAGLQVRTARARSRLDQLTRRERQVLKAITDGLSNREIGERLAISARTVEIHRSNMLSKVGAHHTSEAIKLAIEASLTEPVANRV